MGHPAGECGVVEVVGWKQTVNDVKAGGVLEYSVLRERGAVGTREAESLVQLAVQRQHFITQHK